MYVNNSAYGV
jgi:hypothetical protein